MKRAIYLLLVSLLAVQSAWADDISAGQAMDIARQFVKQDARANARRRVKGRDAEPSLAHAVKSRTTKKDNVYVINLGEDQGFVIVSGEDGADDEILGYCDHGSFDYDKAPVQLKDMLTVYADGVDSLRMHGAPGKKAAVRAKIPAYKLGDIKVAPLLTTTWSQWWPYNQLCPADCPTGCVPTAVAQILNYWKHPEVSTGRYWGEDEAFPKHTYDWDNMLDNYEYGKFTPEQGMAVAQLMADIGKATHTIYRPTGSSSNTNSVQWPLCENFAYSEDHESWKSGKPENLLDLIRKELGENRPVLYFADPDDVTDGHALVIDGYTAKNYFHFNYGWGGSADGYYKNGVCSQFYKNPEIIIGIRPDKNVYREIESDNMLYRLSDDGTAEVVGCMIFNTDDQDLVIPACVTDGEGKEYKVERLGERFLNTHNFRLIKRLEIGDNMKYIAPGIFTSCNIGQLVFRDGVEEISPETFQGTRIGELVLGTGMKRIGYQAFTASTIDKVTCKSPALVVDHGAFWGAHVPDGDWCSVITELGNSAFARAEFPKRPIFTNLEKIGASCFDRASPFFGEFRLSAKIKYVHPQAFYGTQMTSLRMDEGNPYYFMDRPNYLFDHDKTSLVMIFNYVGADVTETKIPETVVKFNPGSIPTLKGPMSLYSITIPKGVEDVTGAFSECEDMRGITCLAVTPPAADENTFSDALFLNNPELTLCVPIGTEELYENAPGWRRFPRILGNQPYVPAPASVDREYYMVVHGSGADGKTLSRRMPVSKVRDIRVGDYVAQDGQTLVIAAEGETNAFKVDSITWMKGFVFGTAEVFDLDPGHLEAKASDCTVRLSTCVIDGPVQLSIRKAVLSTGIRDDAAREVAVDISLSTGEHEVSGIAEIEVPMILESDETLMAAYFNEETGEWEPVLCLYDEKTYTARIITDHFSIYDFFTIKNKGTRKQTLQAVEYITEASLKYYTPYQNFTMAAQTLLNITNSSDPDAEAVNAWKEDVGFWQTVGLDGGYNLLKSVGIANKSVDDAVGVVGKLGTAMAILDVALADIKGDDAALATSMAKAVNSVVGMHLSAVFDASILSVTSGLTAFIGIALEKLGTMVQTAKLDYTRAMYRYYYSEEGHSDCSIHSRFGSKYWRTEKDWFKLLYAYIEKNSDNDRFVTYVEGMVRRYCEQFWDEGSDLQYVCESEAKRLGFSSSIFISESDKQKVCDEYFAELIDGPVTRVMMDIRRKLAKKTKERYDARVKEYVNFMNTPVGFRFRDSSCAEDETSRFSGYKVRFTDTPADVTDGERWECAINDKGTGTLGLFSLFALVDNKIRPQLTLVDTFGDEVATFDYELSKEGRRIILDFDLAKQGTPALSGKNLELTYSTDSLVVSTNIDFYYTLFGETKIVELPEGMKCIFFDFYNLPYFGINVRFQSEVEKFLLAHDSISVEYGKVRMGDDIIGDWDEASQEGSGKFTINTTYPFVICTKDEYIASWNAWEGYIRPGYAYPRLHEILNGSLKHQIDCQFSIKRLKDQSAFEITCTGEGDYRLDAEQVTALTGLDGNSIEYYDGITTYEDWNFCMLKPENVITGPFTDEGTVKLNYTKKIQIK